MLLLLALRYVGRAGSFDEALPAADILERARAHTHTAGECSNAECLYRHVNPEENVKECPWYAQGFCKHGTSSAAPRPDVEAPALTATSRSAVPAQARQEAGVRALPHRLLPRRPQLQVRPVRARAPVMLHCLPRRGSCDADSDHSLGT